MKFNFNNNNKLFRTLNISPKCGPELGILKSIWDSISRKNAKLKSEVILKI